MAIKAYFQGIVDVVNGPTQGQVTLLARWICINTDNGERWPVVIEVPTSDATEDTETKLMNKMADLLNTKGVELSRDNMWTFAAEPNDGNLFTRVINWFKGDAKDPDVTVEPEVK